MLAFCVDGRVIENFEYGLAGTPCEAVLGQRFRILSVAAARSGFRSTPISAHLGVDGYAGFPLTGPPARPLGLIAVMSRRPLADTRAGRGDAQDLRHARRHRDRAPPRRRRRCARARSSTARSSRPRPTRWCCAMRSTGGSTSIRRTSASTASPRDEVIGIDRLTSMPPALRDTHVRAWLERALAGETATPSSRRPRRHRRAHRRRRGAGDPVPAPRRAARARIGARHHRAQAGRGGACARARSSTARSSTPRPTRWCCATPTSASSTSTRPTSDERLRARRGAGRQDRVLAQSRRR